DSGDPRRARLSRSRHPGAAVLQHAARPWGRDTTRLLSRREPLDTEAAELATLVPRVLRLDQTLRAGRSGAVARGERSEPRDHATAAIPGVRADEAGAHPGLRMHARATL